MCDSNGAVVYQEMCMEVKECNHWEGEKVNICLNLLILTIFIES